MTLRSISNFKREWNKGSESFKQLGKNSSSGQKMFTDFTLPVWVVGIITTKCVIKVYQYESPDYNIIISFRKCQFSKTNVLKVPLPKENCDCKQNQYSDQIITKVTKNHESILVNFIVEETL